jgi:hypothetical protein
MKRKWTRRLFLRATVQGSLVVGGAALARPFPAAAAAGPDSPSPDPARDVLRTAIDELIPRQAESPSASEAGGLAYLDARAAADPAFGRDLQLVAAKLEESARARHGPAFTSLTAGERVQALQEVERSAGDLFATLRDAVYEAYYTRPDVWTRIGYDFHAGPEPRGSVARFDETALAAARKRSRLYREVR